MSDTPVIACVGLVKTYQEATASIKVLQQVEFAVYPGELIAIVGNSGSGKSTLLHLLAGLDKPTSGQISVAGRDLAILSEVEKCKLRNQYLGFIYQFHHLLPDFTALENVSMPLLIGSHDRCTIEASATNLLTLVGLQDRMHHKIGELSGGERQRVAIARALVANPLCILADEPTGNLDPYNADKVLQLFFDLQKTHRTSVVMVTHDMRIAKRADKQFLLEYGKLVAA